MPLSLRPLWEFGVRRSVQDRDPNGYSHRRRSSENGRPRTGRRSYFVRQTRRRLEDGRASVGVSGERDWMDGGTKCPRATSSSPGPWARCYLEVASDCRCPWCLTPYRPCSLQRPTAFAQPGTWAPACLPWRALFRSTPVSLSFQSHLPTISLFTVDRPQPGVI